MIKYIDRENRFTEIFNPSNGFYVRSGVIDSRGKDTGVDPFMRNFPGLLDIGIMGNCLHGSSGLCLESGVECYQNGLGIKSPNMSLDNFKSIIEQCKGKVFQIALGGRGDTNKHEKFKEIVEYCRLNNIIPNYTTSGLQLTEEEVAITKEFCGAAAISWYRTENTIRAINMFIDADVKTNIHYVLGNNSIDEAIERLKNNRFPLDINAVIFLLHKPVGLGSEKNVLVFNDPRLKEFFNLVDNSKFNFKIGFDSCSIPAILNFTSNINNDSIDTCEGGRYSAYITSDMKLLPCSFDNQDLKWSYDLNNGTLQEGWNSIQFENFREHLKMSCQSCKDRLMCLGGCPIRRQIVLCERKEKELI